MLGAESGRALLDSTGLCRHGARGVRQHQCAASGDVFGGSSMPWRRHGACRHTPQPGAPPATAVQLPPWNEACVRVHTVLTHAMLRSIALLTTP